MGCLVGKKGKRRKYWYSNTVMGYILPHTPSPEHHGHVNRTKLPFATTPFIDTKLLGIPALFGQRFIRRSKKAKKL